MFVYDKHLNKDHNTFFTLKNTYIKIIIEIRIALKGYILSN